MPDYEDLRDLPPMGEPDDDGRYPPHEDEQPAANGAASSIRAQRFSWIDPEDVPPREWLFGRHLIRKYISATVSPGGVGKSSLEIAEAISMATGKNLTGTAPHGTYRVWYINLEDPLDEIQRRVVATLKHYGLTEADLGGRLFINSGRDTEIVVATQGKNGVTIAQPVIEAMTATILGNWIDVVICDPFVSSHAVNENDNGAINTVATIWAKLADHTGTAIELVHHARKTGGNEVTMEDSRGAVALLAKVRAGRVLNGMTKDEAERAGVETRGTYFRVDRGKGNLAPPSTDASTWYKLASVDLGNGRPLKVGGFETGARMESDSVGVVTPWEWPDAFAGIGVTELRAAQFEVAGCIAAGAKFRLNVQANDWIGKPIARALHLNLENKPERSRVARMFKAWLETGMFVVVPGKDEKGRTRDFVEVGKAATDVGD
jgi:hypothetical protein